MTHVQQAVEQTIKIIKDVLQDEATIMSDARMRSIITKIAQKEEIRFQESHQGNALIDIDTIGVIIAAAQLVLMIIDLRNHNPKNVSDEIEKIKIKIAKNEQLSREKIDLLASKTDENNDK